MRSLRHGVSLKHFNRGNTGRSLLRQVLDILRASVTRATTRTVMGYASGATLADGQSLLTVPIDMPAIKGARLATTVADGAALGSDQGPTFVKSGENGSNTTTLYSDGFLYDQVDSSSVLTVSIVGTFTAGSHYQVDGDLTNNLGSLKLDTGAWEVVDGITSDTFTAVCKTDTTSIPLTRKSIPTNTEYRNITVKQITPTWYSTDINGVALPVEGVDIADAATNILLNSAAPVTQSVSVATGAYTLQVMGVGSAIVSSGLATLTDEAFTSAFDVAVALSFDNIVSASYTVTSADGLTTYADTTDYTVDLVLGTITVLSTGTMLDVTGYLIDYDTTHNYTGEVAATEGAPNTFTVTTAGSVDIAVTDPLSYFQLETGSVKTPIIITTTAAATRDADIWTEPTPSVLSAAEGAIEIVLTPNETGQSNTIFSSIIDSNNRFDFYAAFGKVFFRRKIAGVELTPNQVFTTTEGQEIVIRGAWGSFGFGVSAHNTGDAEPSLTVDSTADDMPLDSTVNIGNFGVATNIFKATDASVTAYKNKQSAGW